MYIFDSLLLMMVFNVEHNKFSPLFCEILFATSVIHNNTKFPKFVKVKKKEPRGDMLTRRTNPEMPTIKSDSIIYSHLIYLDCQK
jgi:hypothetical protein